MVNYEKIFEIIINKLEEEHKEIIRLTKEINARVSRTKLCYICNKEIENICGQEDIVLMPCECCTEPDLTGKRNIKYYCTRCFIKKHSLPFLKSIIDEKEKEKQIKPEISFDTIKVNK